MNRYLATGLMIAGVIGAAVFTAPRMVRAQQGNGGPHVIVVNDVMHVVGPPLRGERPIPPAVGLNRNIPLRHPVPLQSAVNVAPDPVLQTSIQPLVSVTNGLNFLGVGVGLNGISGDSYIPPDTNGAVGDTQYVQWVNASFAVFNKSTGNLVYGPYAGNMFWQKLGGACASNNSGDPIAQYDKQMQRWVMMQPVFSSPYYLCVAVSTSSDATGSYNLYQFPIPGNGFPDYPKLAVWPDGYYVSFNDFGSNGNSFQGGYACAMDRTKMLAGNTATMQCFNTGYPSLLPGDLDGDSGAAGTTAAPPAGSPDYFLDFYGSSVYLWKFHVDWTNSANTTLTGPTTVSGVAPFSAACSGGGTCIPEPSGSVSLDSLADRLMYRLAYRNFGDHESLVISHSVSTGSGNVGVRWYEIRSPGTNPTVYQQGTFAPDSKYRWMPSAAMDEKGDIALGYSVSSSSSYPAIAYTARLSTDPLNTMETEAQIVQGTGGQTSYSRWGDYSAMTIDPNDDCTFWYTNEFHNVTGAFTWSTQIASFTLTGCTSPPTPDFSISASPTSQTVTAGGTTGAYTITITPSNNYTGNVALSIVAGLPNGATPTFTPSTVSGGSGTSSLTISTSSGLAAGSYPLTVQGTDGTLTHTTGITLVVQTPDFSITGSPSSQTVTQGGSTSYTIGLTGSNGYSGSVTLTATGLPSGANATFPGSPVSVSGTSTINSTMNVTTSSNTPGGSYTITVTGTDANNLMHSTTVTLVVQGPPPDFTIGASPLTLTVPPGSTGQYIVSIGAVNSFSGTVNFSVSGLPSRTSSSFNPSSVTGAGSTTLTISPNRRASNGTYPLTITGTSGSLTHSVNVTLVIGTVSTPDYSLSASPTSHTVTQGTGTTYSITATPSGGYIGNIALSASGNPANSTVSFNPASDNITGTSAASSTMTVTTTASTQTGTFTITVTGTDGTIQHTTTVTLVVQSATQTGDFQITISPSSQTISKKLSVSYTVTITPSNGFTGNVSLTLGTLPSGISGSLSRSTVTGGSGTSTLTLSAGGHPSTGTYMITVTGTSGGLTHPSTTQLIVQ